MTPELARGLQAVAAAMAEARDAWWIIGSAAVALHSGGPLAVADIDVLATPADALRLAELWGATPDPPGEHPLFRSSVHFGHRLAGAAVDIMADLEVNGPDGWVMLRPKTRMERDIGVTSLPVPDRDELIEILRLFGRPKDLERAALLQTVAG